MTLKLGAILVGIALILVGIIFVYSKADSYWQKWRDEIVQQERLVQQQLLGQLKDVEKQKTAALAELQKIRAEKAVLVKRVETLKGENNDLQKRLVAVVVPSEPSAIVTEFHNLGLGSVRLRTNP